MKNILFIALLAGTSAVEATPLSAASLPLTIQQTPQDPAPMSKAELKRRRKLRRQNGPEVYKGSVAEQTRVITDATGSQKDDGEAEAPKGKKGKKKN